MSGNDGNARPLSSSILSRTVFAVAISLMFVGCGDGWDASQSYGDRWAEGHPYLMKRLCAAEQQLGRDAAVQKVSKGIRTGGLSPTGGIPISRAATIANDVLDHC
jgi:hypothetical protein